MNSVHSEARLSVRGRGLARRGRARGRPRWVPRLPDGAAVVRLSVAALAVVLCLPACHPGAQAPETRSPNVLLVSIDTLRADRLGLYGHSRTNTPQLRELASGGVVFEEFIHSGGGTLPSHMSMMTSLRPRVHWVTPRNERVLEDQRVTLAESLREEGYATAAFVDGGWVRGKFGFSQGFGVYDDSGGHLERILPKAYEWLADGRTDPWFLFLHTYDVHSSTDRLPYECPEEFWARYLDGPPIDGCREGRCASELLKHVNQEIQSGDARLKDFFSEDELSQMSAMYDGCIAYVDRELGRLFQWMKERELYEDTMIVVTSDHGEEFGDHGMVLHQQGAYEELAHIPLIVKFPKGRFAGRRVFRLAAMVDLMPTILDVTGTRTPDQAQGRNLEPAIVDGSSVRDSVHIWASVRTERWKYLHRQQELYDLRSDPQEQRNLIPGERPDGVLERLVRRVEQVMQSDVARYESFQADLDASSASKPVELDEDERRRLEALGYL